jgi:hypothetical protein
MKLDERWSTGYWQSDHFPPVPADYVRRVVGGAWLVVGGLERGEETDPSTAYLDEHPIHICA